MMRWPWRKVKRNAPRPPAEWAGGATIAASGPTTADVPFTVRSVAVRMERYQVTRIDTPVYVEAPSGRFRVGVERAVTIIDHHTGVTVTVTDPPEVITDEWCAEMIALA